MGARVLRGHHGANAVAELIEPIVFSLARPVPGHPPSKKYLAFAARSKAGPSPYTSPAIRPTRAPRSPPHRSLQTFQALEPDDEMCVGALCSLAFHAFSEAENSAASHIPPGARWWDNVEAVHKQPEHENTVKVQRVHGEGDAGSSDEASPYHFGTADYRSSCEHTDAPLGPFCKDEAGSSSYVAVKSEEVLQEQALTRSAEIGEASRRNTGGKASGAHSER
jgi:hypothetical protein